jgi:E3 ubiquitin-protein ligase RGLG
VAVSAEAEAADAAAAAEARAAAEAEATATAEAEAEAAAKVAAAAEAAEAAAASAAAAAAAAEREEAARKMLADLAAAAAAEEAAAAAARDAALSAEERARLEEKAHSPWGFAKWTEGGDTWFVNVKTREVAWEIGPFARVVSSHVVTTDERGARAVLTEATHAAEGVGEMLRANGVASTQLAVFVDCTMSNTTNGATSNGGRSLHDVSEPEASPSPYAQVISAVGRTLYPLDADGRVPLYGFGDAATADTAVFSFVAADGGAAELDSPEALVRAYEERIGSVKLAGPTSFAPAIRKATELSQQRGNKDLVFCLIICDGPMNVRAHTEAALVEAGRLPVIVVCVGVGDGPFDALHKLEADLNEAKRGASNFRFVEHRQIALEAAAGGLELDAALALACMSSVPAVVANLVKNNYYVAARANIARLGR